MVGVGAFEFGNLAATLLILRASELLAPGRGQDRATQLALGLYVAHNLAATLASIPAGRLGDRRGAVLVLVVGVGLFGLAYAGFAGGPATVLALAPWFVAAGVGSAVWRRPSTPLSRPWRRWSCGVGVRAAGGGAELRQSGRQRHPRSALDARLAAGGLRLPGRLDAARPRWPVGSRSQPGLNPRAAARPPASVLNRKVVGSDPTSGSILVLAGCRFRSWVRRLRPTVGQQTPATTAGALDALAWQVQSRQARPVPPSPLGQYR
jgi:hypothetical protein